MEHGGQVGEDGADVIRPYAWKSIFHVKEDREEVDVQISIGYQFQKTSKKKNCSYPKRPNSAKNMLYTDRNTHWERMILIDIKYGD